MTSLRSDEITFHVAQCLNALGHLASPAAWQASQAGHGTREGRPSLRHGIMVSLNGVAEILRSAGPDLELPTGPVNAEQLSHALNQLFEQAQTWHDGPPPPPLVAGARACLQLLGVPEPPQGWENFRPDHS